MVALISLVISKQKAHKGGRVKRDNYVSQWLEYTNCKAYKRSRAFEAKTTGVKWLQKGEPVLL